MNQVKKWAAMSGACAIVLSLNTAVLAQEYPLETEEQRYSYAVGTKIAAQLVQQFGREGSGIDFAGLRAGLNAVLSGEGALMSDEEADLAIESKRKADQQVAVAAAGEQMAKGAAFREEFAGQEGVMNTESGLLYKVMNAGEGDKVPTADDTVVVHYQGTLIDGSVFDSSYARGEPATFPLSGIIPGWQEILQLMKSGDKWQVFIPPELAYGERGAGASIGPNETLMFEIELIEIK